MKTRETPTQVHKRLYAAWEAGPPSFLNGMVILEQKAKASVALKLCVECDDLGVVYTPPGGLLQATGYYMCQDCSDYWRNKE